MTEFHAWCKVFMDRGTPGEEAVERVKRHGVDQLRADFSEHHPELVAKVDALIAPCWRWTEPDRRSA
jgi:hypothetical protein